MTHPSNDSPAANSDPLSLALIILAFYLACMVPPLAQGVGQTQGWVPLIAHATALLLVTLALSARVPPTMRAWTPLAVGPFLYVELRWLIPDVGHMHADRLVRAWESQLFSSDPSRMLALRFPSALLSELLHAAYLSYYALVYVPPTLLWMRGQRREFATTILAMTIVYGGCFTTYVVLPVDGPRFLVGPAAAPPGAIRSVVLSLLESGSSRGTAFPSSHVAAAVVAALCALRFQPRVGILVTLLAIGVALGAVYGGFHYGVDVVAGALAGCAATALGLLLERWARRAPHSR